MSELGKTGKNETAVKIGDQVSMSYRTVERSAEFTSAVDTIVRVTGSSEGMLIL